MSYVLRTEKGDVDLGPSIEFFQFVKSLGQQVQAAKRDGEFKRLLSLVDLNEEQQGADEAAAIGKEAAEALDSLEFSGHGQWVLKELSALGGEGVRKSGSIAFIKNDEERVVGGVVYAPDEVDGQGDWTDGREIWKAMKRYMAESGGTMKIMHGGLAVRTPIVECFQAEQPTMKGGEPVPAGAWYMTVHVPPEHEALWKAIKGGEITGFSMAGHAETEENG